MNIEPELFITYWVSTKGRKILLFTIPSNEKPNEPIFTMYGMTKCNRLVYWIFKKTRINLIAKDKFAWLKH